MIGELSPWHLAIIAVAVVVLFGSAKLPDAARSLGRSLRIFRSEMKALHDQQPLEEIQPAASVLAQPVSPVLSTDQPAPAQDTQRTS